MLNSEKMFKMLGITAFLAALFILGPFLVQGSAPSGLPSTLAIATTTEVGPDLKKTIFSSSDLCTARSISTSDGTGRGINFTTGEPLNGDFSSSALSAVNGNWQAGSTTVTYDSGLNGCGQWSAMAAASTTITVVEYR